MDTSHTSKTDVVQEGSRSVAKPEGNLLNIPAELRIRIYQFSMLVDQHPPSCHPLPYVVSESDHQEPALLRTCRQICSEALKIWREENSFELTINNFDFEPQRHHWAWKTEPSIEASGDAVNFAKFVDIWLQPYWKELVHDPLANDDEKDQEDLPSWASMLEVLLTSLPDEFDDAQKIAETLAVPGLEWKTVRKVLAIFQRALERDEPLVDDGAEDEDGDDEGDDNDDEDRSYYAARLGLGR